jgi:hypothetical protein
MFNQFPIDFYYDGKYYKGQIKPLLAGAEKRKPTLFQVFLNQVYYGLVRQTHSGWETDSPKCAVMMNTIGNHIYDWYE